MSLGLIIADFKRTEKPTILISPMLFEGVDLPGNYSRFQIIVKAPYYAMNDARIIKIMRNYPKVYRQMLSMRLIQALGRSTRFKGDQSFTYFIDSNIARLYRSKYNSWRDQFNEILISYIRKSEYS